MKTGEMLDLGTKCVQWYTVPLTGLGTKCAQWYTVPLTGLGTKCVQWYTVPLTGLGTKCAQCYSTSLVWRLLTSSLLTGKNLCLVTWSSDHKHKQELTLSWFFIRCIDNNDQCTCTLHHCKLLWNQKKDTNQPFFSFAVITITAIVQFKFGLCRGAAFRCVIDWRIHSTEEGVTQGGELREPSPANHHTSKWAVWAYSSKSPHK